MSTVRERARYLWSITCAVLRSDTMPIRVTMGWTSIGLGVGYLLTLSTFERPAYAWMEAIAPQWAWALVFLVYGTGVLWRVYAKKRRENAGLFFNALGFVAWFMQTLAITISIGTFVPILTLDWVASAALFVTLVRTGRSPDHLSHLKA